MAWHGFEFPLPHYSICMPSPTPPSPLCCVRCCWLVPHSHHIYPFIPVTDRWDGICFYEHLHWLGLGPSHGTICMHVYPSPPHFSPTIFPFSQVLTPLSTYIPHPYHHRDLLYITPPILFFPVNLPMVCLHTLCLIFTHFTFLLPGCLGSTFCPLPHPFPLPYPMDTLLPLPFFGTPSTAFTHPHIHALTGFVAFPFLCPHPYPSHYGSLCLPLGTLDRVWDRTPCLCSLPTHPHFPIFPPWLDLFPFPTYPFTIYLFPPFLLPCGSCIYLMFLCIAILAFSQVPLLFTFPRLCGMPLHIPPYLFAPMPSHVTTPTHHHTFPPFIYSILLPLPHTHHGWDLWDCLTTLPHLGSGPLPHPYWTYLLGFVSGMPYPHPIPHGLTCPPTTTDVPPLTLVTCVCACIRPPPVYLFGTLQCNVAPYPFTPYPTCLPPSPPDLSSHDMTLPPTFPCPLWDCLCMYSHHCLPAPMRFLMGPPPPPPCQTPFGTTCPFAPHLPPFTYIGFIPHTPLHLLPTPPLPTLTYTTHTFTPQLQTYPTLCPLPTTTGTFLLLGPPCRLVRFTVIWLDHPHPCLTLPY